MPEAAGARWLPIRVGTDVALMLALAHTLLVENLWDRAFVARYCTGFDIFERYLLGRDDDTPKDAAWAADITGIAADTIVGLARRLPRGRTLITVSHSLQRAQYGEQPVWMGAVLAAMLGQIGLPGGGYNYALGALGHTGRRLQRGADSDAVAGQERRRRLHPGGAHRRHAAQSRRAVRL